MNSDKTGNSKKLGIYISFKSNEKELYDETKLIQNYSTVVKELLAEYLENKKRTQIKSEKSMFITVDDLCKIISSVNSVSREIPQKEVYNGQIDANHKNTYSDTKEDIIPENMLSGL